MPKPTNLKWKIDDDDEPQQTNRTLQSDIIHFELDKIQEEIEDVANHAKPYVVQTVIDFSNADKNENNLIQNNKKIYKFNGDIIYETANNIAIANVTSGIFDGNWIKIYKCYK